MKITFFCKVDKEALSIVEFYKQDIEILKELGHEVHIATSYKEISWSSDLIFVWWWTYAFFPVFLGKILRKPVIITGTFNYYAPESPIDFFRRPLWQRLLIKYAIKNATHNILVSKNEFDLISNDWKLKNISYSPHVVDTQKYVPAEKNFHEKYIFSIIWTGKTNLLRKCLPEIIESAEEVLKKEKNLKFIIAGRKGDGFEFVQSLIESKKLTEKVVLLGEISEEEKIKYLQNCLIYLQPSKYEGFGLAVAEAMSCGAPVITTDVGEVENVVGEAGILLSGYDPTEITEAIFKLLNSESYRFELGQKARARILNNFGQDVRKKDIKKIIQIINKK